MTGKADLEKLPEPPFWSAHLVAAFLASPGWQQDLLGTGPSLGLPCPSPTSVVTSEKMAEAWDLPQVTQVELREIRLMRLALHLGRPSSLPLGPSPCGPG
jgi:hypothetical protein